MAVDVSTNGKTFTAGVPKRLFDAPFGQGSTDAHHWDVTADGKKFLISAATEGAATPITVVLNWQAGLKK